MCSWDSVTVRVPKPWLQIKMALMAVLGSGGYGGGSEVKTGRVDAFSIDSDVCDGIVLHGLPFALCGSKVFTTFDVIIQTCPRSRVI